MSANRPAAPLRLTVDELAARAGVTVRTLRFYSGRGLLPPPELGPRRVGLYGAEHLDRLELIEELQRLGLTLAAIERYLDQLPDDLSALDLAIHRALIAVWAPETAEQASVEQLSRRTGRELSRADLDQLVAMGALQRTDDEGLFTVDPGLLPLGARVLDLPIPLETIVTARAVVRLHSRAAAQELNRLFRETVWKPFRESAPAAAEVDRMRELTGQIEPLLTQALVTAFHRSLAEQLAEGSG
ncbi:DNA-binding transcriptional MerR regulator [Kitasatospora sp. MAP12-15]|uniref:MerR family transcriptional regulator n=1 Tax=unclassified Kitasatospora TaxID=2633591 RepID=UPI0024769E56|nr:MerR family transcriptional regulator [Kitasatospora sp. MAP12-44]MDH6109763.1 DNA-binding transcriptional MerR regulator [Kitasatospora sp. MAP12-44]